MDEPPKVVELPDVVVQLRDDGIVEYRYTTTGQVDLDLARSALEAARSLSDAPRPTIVHINKVAGVTRDARLLFASEENARVASRVALIIDSPLSRIVGNFFMGFNKPLIPVQLFTDVGSATDWLLRAG